MDIEKDLLGPLTDSTDRSKPEYLFALLALVFGTVLAIVNGPFQNPDEGAHFWRSYHLSQGNLITSRQGDKVGGRIPAAIPQLTHSYDYLIGQQELRIDKVKLEADLDKPFDEEKKIFYDFFTQALYTPTVYAPQAIGIAMARGLGLSLLKMMYVGRLSALLCWTAIVFAAIRITPVFKWVFVLIALVPRSLFQAASLSADGPTNAMAFLLTAAILREVLGSEPGLKKVDALLICIFAVILSVAKQAYLPLVGMVFLIPAGKFGGWRNKLIFCGVVIGFVVMATFLWSMVIKDFYRPWNEADAPKQMELLMARPWIFLVVVFNSLVESWRALFFSFIGVLGFLDVWLPKWIYRTYPFVLIAVALFDSGSGKPLRWFHRLWFVFLCICTLFLIELSMYLIWTKPGASIVDGVHGRYFIPLAVPVMLSFFYNRRLRILKQWVFPLIFGLYIALALTASCWVVYARYYGPETSGAGGCIF